MWGFIAIAAMVGYAVHAWAALINDVRKRDTEGTQ